MEINLQLEGKNIQYYEEFKDNPLKSLPHQGEYYASGGTCNIRKVKISDSDYVIKLFQKKGVNEDWIRNTSFTGLNEDWIRNIKYNLSDKVEIISNSDFFVSPKIIPLEDGEDWYLMDFFESTNLFYLISSKTLNPENIGSVLLKYGEMLKYLHKNEHIYVDNNPKNILLNCSEIRVCDCDLISSISDVEQNKYEFFKNGAIVCAPFFGSHAQLTGKPPNFLSDLEGFSLIIDTVYRGKPYLNEVNNDMYEMFEQARENDRDYVPVECIPKNLATLITPYIKLPHPKNLSDSIDDFICAIKEDFNL